MIAYSEVRSLNRRGNVIPLYVRIPSDVDTPVSAYLKLARRSTTSFLLESVEGGEKLARYSFLGFDPFLTVRGDGRSVRVQKGRRTHDFEVSSLDFLRELFKTYKPVRVPDLPRFTGGGVGYFSYDAIRWIENIPDENDDPIGLPEMMFGIYNRLVVFDHLKQEMVVIANILHDEGQPGLRQKYAHAKQSILDMSQQLARPIKVAEAERRSARTRQTALYSSQEYERMVRKAKRYIKEGDIFQVVLSQRWRISSRESELEVYRRLRRINPSPYMYLLRFGDDSVIGASPEMMVRIEGSTIETRPIAGTRPRGRDAAHDDKLAKSLMADPKELAEHTMLLDLGRNDIGRVSKPGTVNVRENMIIEKYSHVMHIVSSVEGRLKRSVSPLEGHFSCFPAGTVSGAPKIRAMEIIDELEKHRRGVYAGSVAYLDFWGNLDSCIAIRTVVKQDRDYYIQAGAGIVADSRPRREYQETVSKAMALIEAIKGKGKP
jgi:anthranilate synthase component 1